MAIKGGYLFLAGMGGLLVYSAISNKSFASAFRDVLSGQSPKDALSANLGIGNSGLITASSSGTENYPSSTALEKLWTKNGGSPDTAVIAAQIAMAESGGSATVTSSNPDGGTNVGIWQLDTNGVGSGYSVAQLQNPNLNAQITIKATGDGINWSEWSDPVANALPGHQYTPQPSD
jgi:Lysozyme like domain